MILGFTGTWHQPPPAQEITLRKLFVGVDTLHHGDCIGADALAHSIAVEYGIKIVVHPPLNERKRAWMRDGAEVRARYEYLERNQHIVDECDHLIAVPYTNVEVPRSGTWSTVRRARKANKPLTIVWPDGSVTEERR